MLNSPAKMVMRNSDLWWHLVETTDVCFTRKQAQWFLYKRKFEFLNAKKLSAEIHSSGRINQLGVSKLYLWWISSAKPNAGYRVTYYTRCGQWEHNSSD